MRRTSKQRSPKLVHASEHGDTSVLTAFEEAYQPVLDGMLETLGRLGIHFDRFTKESLFVTNGDVGRLMESLGNLEINGSADNGAQYLDLGARGLKGKTEFFYRRGDGSSLYATRDIAYHIWKWQQSNELINVLGEDHKLQAQQVGLTLEELGHKRPEVMFYSFIKLPEGKMSTRRGNVVFMDDLLEEAKAQAAAVVTELRPEYDQETVANIAEAVGTRPYASTSSTSAQRKDSPSVGRTPLTSNPVLHRSSCTAIRVLVVQSERTSTKWIHLSLMVAWTPRPSATSPRAWWPFCAHLLSTTTDWKKWFESIARIFSQNTCFT